MPILLHPTRCAWTLMLLGGCSGGSAPEVTGAVVSSAGTLKSCQALVLTLPVTSNTHYVQVRVSGPVVSSISGGFSEPGASSVAIPFRVAIQTAAPFKEIAIESIMLRTDGGLGDESYRTEYTAKPGAGVFAVKRCEPYVEKITSHGLSTTCIVAYEGPSSVPVPAPVKTGTDPACKQYYLETFANGSSLGAAQRGKAMLSMEVLDSEKQPVASDLFEENYVRLSPQLRSGERALIRVQTSTATWGGYSIRVSATGFGGKSTAKPATPDAYEPDGSAEEARPLTLDAVQDRTLDYVRGVRDEDWMAFTPP